LGVKVALQVRPQDRNKLVVGAILLIVAALVLYRNLSWNGSAPSAPAKTGRALESPAQPARAPRAAARVAGGWRQATQRFSGQPLDPKLRLDLLARVQNVTYQGTERNIFQYQAPPAAIPQPAAPAVTKGSEAKPAGSSQPSPSPIPLKYFGYAHKPGDTAKKAFFVNGEEIFIAAEGEVVNKRYRIVKIGVNTVEAEDLVTKHKQTLPLQENP